MSTTTGANQRKIETIMANAKRNQREARKFDLTAVTSEAEERLKAESITDAQVELLGRLGVDVDPRPISEGGTVSRWNAMKMVDAALTEANVRREEARAEPPTEKQQIALLKFGCNVDDLNGLTRGEASDLIRNFTRDIEARKRIR